MREHTSFICSSCRRRLRASLRFVGRTCECPNCGHTIVVPPSIPSEEDPLLVMDDGHRLPRGPRTFSV
jgi:DNA-directed RNA polymerase subunit RPC12/RpoP